MKLKYLLFGERSLTKVAALFNSPTTAQEAANRVRTICHMADSQVKIVSPADQPSGTAFSTKIEPELKGIWHTLVRAHLWMGIAGMLAGALLFVLLYALDNISIRSTPLLSLLAFLGFGLMFGLMLGGLFTLRPDHGHVITVVRQAVEQGRWAVVAHPTDPAQVDSVIKALARGSERVVKTF
ncbi:riboflavin biosynthesis protein RibA [Chitinimonas lacunae]|uniref:Riboflavin biosynthesis protein RibA n=1 Tax=Chitinimonas lacunae TaxID=1963018 RepID=A0ABV8MQA0_9NEIS